MKEPMTFDEVRAVNAARRDRWHPGYPNDGWSGADWSNAMCGEAGEAANIVKKLRRWETDKTGNGDPSPDDLRAMLADEVADVFLYLDLLAAFYGIDLPTAIISKFNRVSERQGFPERLRPASSSTVPCPQLAEWALDNPKAESASPVPRRVGGKEST